MYLFISSLLLIKIGSNFGKLASGIIFIVGPKPGDAKRTG
jgi:hypothetical protein